MGLLAALVMVMDFLRRWRLSDGDSDCGKTAICGSMAKTQPGVESDFIKHHHCSSLLLHKHQVYFTAPSRQCLVVILK